MCRFIVILLRFALQDIYRGLFKYEYLVSKFFGRKMQVSSGYTLKSGVLLTATLCAVISSCSVQPDGHVAIGETCIISDYQYSDCLVELQDYVGADLIGARSVKVVDSLLVVDQIKNWSVFSLESGKYYGNCLTTGQGPYDFNSIPFMSSVTFETGSDSIVAYVADKSRGRMMSFNITDFVSGDMNHARELYKSAHLSNETWTVLPIDSSAISILKPENDFSSLCRMIVNGDDVYVPSIINGINDASLSSGDDLNLLTRVIGHNRNRRKSAEAFCHMNQLIMYSDDGTWGQTIVVGDQLPYLKEVERVPREDLKSEYVSLAAWNCGFGALRVGMSQKEMYYNQDDITTELQVFDWDGRLIYICKLPHRIISMDIDFKHNVLYCIDGDDLALKAYDATPIFS